jgi:hypothetical protein
MTEIMIWRNKDTELYHANVGSGGSGVSNSSGSCKSYLMVSKMQNRHYFLAINDPLTRNGPVKWYNESWYTNL